MTSSGTHPFDLILADHPIYGMKSGEHAEANESSEDEAAAKAAAAAAASAKLLDQLISGSVGPLSRLQDAVDLTLEQVAEWIGESRNRKQIANLITLLDAQVQLVVCQHRLIAVARLADVAATAESPETVRRACADLLKIRLIDPYKEDKRPESPVNEELQMQIELRKQNQELSRMSEDKLLAALERMGQEDWESQFPPGQAPPQDDPVAIQAAVAARNRAGHRAGQEKANGFVTPRVDLRAQTNGY